MVDAIVLAVALSMDATAPAACGAAGAATTLTLRMAWLFAAFHIAMCMLGWAIRSHRGDLDLCLDHWVVFGLLTVIGAKMVWSALRSDPVALPTGWGVLVGLAVATSIDAIGAGVTLPLVAAPELVTIGMIGGVVFVFVLVGAKIGITLGARFGRGLQIAGGVTIVGLGVKTLVEHLW